MRESILRMQCTQHVCGSTTNLPHRPLTHEPSRFDWTCASASRKRPVMACCRSDSDVREPSALRPQHDQSASDRSGRGPRLASSCAICATARDITHGMHEASKRVPRVFDGTASEELDDC